ncbi:MAG: hypothetical protein FWE45_04110 [Firmicutes bacterium]|nr:hypothetical protein [Bacillota bacterium]
MSFYADRRHPRPGPIPCNPLHACGLHHRVAIEARRILDSAIRKETLEDVPLVINERTLPPPVRFISATTTQTAAPISNIAISRIKERPAFARVSCDVITPLSVCFECEQGVRYTGTSQVSCHHDIVLYVPEQDSIFPFEVVAQTSASAPVGDVDLTRGLIYATICSTAVIKVVTESDLLVPVFGHAPPGNAITFKEDVCKEFFELPLYPMGK